MLECKFLLLDIVMGYLQVFFGICRVSVVTNNASPGKHILTCEVMKETTDPDGGHEFRLIAVDAS